MIDTSGHSSRSDQLRAASATLSLADLQSAPFDAEPRAGGDPAASLVRIRADERSISMGLMRGSQSPVANSLLANGGVELSALEPAVAHIHAIAACGTVV